MHNASQKKVGVIVSSVLVGAGLLLLGLSLLPGVGMKITLPLIFLMCGSALVLLVFLLSNRFNWAGLFYIPGCLLLAFGVIFLLNVTTGDWSAWAYAWLLLPAAIGLGGILAGRRLGWPQSINLAAGGLFLAGIIFFGVFGAIAGGLFIQVMAPLLLIAGGLAIRWAGLGEILSGRFFQAKAIPAREGPVKAAQAGLVEPLSAREVEVLRLIGAGLSNVEIASQLTVAQSTVKTHINNLYAKLEVQTRTQAIKRGRELGLLD